jgi:hypothetical protein
MTTAHMSRSAEGVFSSVLNTLRDSPRKFRVLQTPIGDGKVKFEAYIEVDGYLIRQTLAVGAPLEERAVNVNELRQCFVSRMETLRDQAAKIAKESSQLESAMEAIYRKAQSKVSKGSSIEEEGAVYRDLLTPQIDPLYDLATRPRYITMGQMRRDLNLKPAEYTLAP